MRSQVQSISLGKGHVFVCRALADFIRAFGGEDFAQAAWGLTRLSLNLPPLPPCPVLAGWESNPAQALEALRHRSIIPGDTLATGEKPVMSDRLDDYDVASDANLIVLEPVILPLAAAWWHGRTAAAALSSSSDPRSRQAGRVEGDFVITYCQLFSVS